MHPLLKKAATDISRLSLIKPGHTVLVGLSGGPDSVALLVALTSLGYKCIAVHCNFHLRGEESDRDQKHAAQLAESLNVPFIVKHFDVNAYIDRCEQPTSIEMACRDLRYDWFQTLLKEHKADSIAVGHNSDDNAETLLMNLFRGTGLSGLRAMRPNNGQKVIRPLLHCSRKEIDDFLEQTGYTAITDSSNLKCDYMRNKLRNKVMPVIKEHFPNAGKGITKTIDILFMSELFYQQSLREKYNKYSNKEGDIYLSKLVLHEPMHALLLYEWLSETGVSEAQAMRMVEASGQSGRKFPIGHGYYYIDREMLRFRPNIETSFDFKKLFEVSEHPVSQFNPTNDRLTAYFDADILKKGQFKVRRWKKGDRIKPFGMNGTKKISDIFNDAKIPVGRKLNVPIVTLGGEILWVTGLRASRSYQITNRTTRYVSVRYIGPAIF